MKALIVVDMQNDFIDGSLGTNEAQGVVLKVAEKIKSHNSGPIFYTMDTHEKWYLHTLEGEKLPVEHCIEDTEGWRINELIDREFIRLGTPAYCVFKKTFGADWIIYKEVLDDCNEIELCGLCTDICVISNALILRAMYPNKKITVDSSCCAGVTPEKHEAALEVMRSCQIDVI